MRQLRSRKCVQNELRRCFEDCDLVSHSSEWRMMDCGDMPGPQDPNSSSQVATCSEMVYVPLFCTQPNVPRGCYLAWMRVCECLCVSVWASSLQRGGWSGLENILCDSTSGIAFLSSDIPFSLLHCNSLTVHSFGFVQVPVLNGMMWQPMSSANFTGLPKGEIEKFSVWTKRVETQTQTEWKKRFFWVCASLYFIFMTLVGERKKNCDCKRSLSSYDEIIAWR